MAENYFLISEDQYYELISFLISNAYLFYKGEQYEELYPSFRMMDAAYRLTKIIAARGGFAQDAWATQFMQSCEKNFDKGVDDQTFVDFINESSLSIAKELKSRSKLSNS